MAADVDLQKKIAEKKKKLAFAAAGEDGEVDEKTKKAMERKAAVIVPLPIHKSNRITLLILKKIGI
jgi:hypothetical protein